MEVGEVLKLLRCSSFEEALARFRARTAHEAITRLVERGVVAQENRRVQSPPCLTATPPGFQFYGLVEALYSLRALGAYTRSSVK